MTTIDKCTENKNKQTLKQNGCKKLRYEEWTPQTWIIPMPCCLSCQQNEFNDTKRFSIYWYFLNTVLQTMLLITVCSTSALVVLLGNKQSLLTNSVIHSSRPTYTLYYAFYILPINILILHVHLNTYSKPLASVIMQKKPHVSVKGIVCPLFSFFSS